MVACCSCAHRDGVERGAGVVSRALLGAGEVCALSQLGGRKMDELMRQCGP